MGQRVYHGAKSCDDAWKVTLVNGRMLYLAHKYVWVQSDNKERKRHHTCAHGKEAVGLTLKVIQQWRGLRHGTLSRQPRVCTDARVGERPSWRKCGDSTKTGEMVRRESCEGRWSRQRQKNEGKPEYLERHGRMPRVLKQSLEWAYEG